MAIVVVVLAVLSYAAIAVDGSHRHHFSRLGESYQYNKEECSTQNEQLRNEVVKKSKCGEPKEIFVTLPPPQTSYFEVAPSAVWVKRCVGLCDHEPSGAKCVATKTRIEIIPVRIYNSKTEREMCSSYAVEVHESCGCCSKSSGDCAAPTVYNPPEPEYEVESH